MSVQTIQQEWSKGQFRPVYVCYGTELQLMEDFLGRLTAMVLEPGQKELAYVSFDLNETALDEVMDEVETLPFMVPRKLVVAHQALFLTGKPSSKQPEHDTERLVAYLDKPVDFTVLVLCVPADKLDERKKITKRLKKEGSLVPFLPLQAKGTVRWICTYAAEQGLHIKEDVAEKLVQVAGTSLQDLKNELDKLALYIGDGETVSFQHIDRVATRSLEQNVFALIDDIVHSRIEQGISRLHDLLKQREEPIKIVALMVRQFRMILQVHGLHRQGYSQQQIAGQIKAHPYAVKLAARQASHYPEKELAHILSGLAELDYAMKTGRVDKANGLEMWIMRFALSRGKSSVPG